MVMACNCVWADSDGSDQPISKVLAKYGLPIGLLPDAIKSYSLADDGSFKVELTSTCYIQFNYLVYYDKIITGKLSYGKIADLNGIEAKEFFIWVDVTGITVDLPSADYIYFNVGIISKKIKISWFESVHACKKGLGNEFEAAATGEILRDGEARDEVHTTINLKIARLQTVSLLEENKMKKNEIIAPIDNGSIMSQSNCWWHDECAELADGKAEAVVVTSEPSVPEILAKYGLPIGLMPDSVRNFSLFDHGGFKVELEKPCEVQFSYLVSYDSVVQGKITYGKITELSGIRAKKLLIWRHVTGIEVDVPNSGYIYFHVGAISKKMDISLFESLHSCRDSIGIGKQAKKESQPSLIE
ncbi:hypothetical protein KI387_006931, partial [Taxus chinensis]